MVNMLSYPYTIILVVANTYLRVERMRSGLCISLVGDVRDLKSVTFSFCRVISTPLFEGHRLGEWYPVGYACQLFFCALLALHLFWFALILRIALQKLLTVTVRSIVLSESRLIVFVCTNMFDLSSLLAIF